MKVWFRHSLTIFWARLQVAAGLLLTVLAFASEFIQSANVVQYLPPQWTSGALIAMGLITELARRRKEWQGS